jgi:hypothetical protein
MDPTGFAVGVVGLAGLVSTCIEAFQIIRSIKAYSRDTEILFTKLDIEKELFMQWAQRVGLLKKHTIDGRLFDRRTDALIYRMLKEIKRLLYDAAGMEGKYGETLQVPIGHHYDRRREEYDVQEKKVSIGRKFLWTVHGRDELKSLIDELGYFVGKLKDMIPSIEQRKATCRELKDAGGDVATLSTLMLAEGRSEYGYDSSEDVWEDLAGELTGHASKRSGHRRRKSRPERSEDGHIDEKSRRRRREEEQIDEKSGRRTRDHDEEHRRRRQRSPSRMSERSHRSSHSSSGSYKSSRNTLVEMFDDMRVGGARSTFR